MSRPVVIVAEELSAAGLELLAEEFEVRHVDGADRAALLAALPAADALIVRSATKVDAEALRAGSRLKVVARAGIGLDNVDVPAATAAGVMVVNAPTSNIVSAAEHAVGLLLACARHLVPAATSLRAGQWRRSAFTGVELAGKTAGLLGLGRIGVLVAQRLSGFGMRVVAYDPYVSQARAAQVGVRLLALEDLLAESDVISVHLPKTPETVGILGPAAFARMKPGVLLVNAARGGLVDEAALAAAIESGRVAGAALDVFAVEPPVGNPLLALDAVLAVPHLGASTVEAQEKAGTAVARSVRLALSGEFVPDAVNVQAGGVVVEEVRPYLGLAETLGTLVTGLAEGLPAHLTVVAAGELAGYEVGVLSLAALRGLFAPVSSESVSYVNAPLLAEAKGVGVDLLTHAETPAHRSLLTLKGTMPDGHAVSVSGTLYGPSEVPRIVEVDGFDIDIEPSDHLAFLRYEDRPGIVGTVGALLGDAGVNIAAMQVSRTRRGGEALMAITVDSAIPVETLGEIEAAIGADSARAVDLV